MKPETRRLLGFGALAMGAHFLMLFDGFYSGSRRPYLNPQPAGIRVQIANIEPRTLRAQLQRAAKVDATPTVAPLPSPLMHTQQPESKPPSSTLSETPDVDVPAQLLEEIFLPQNHFDSAVGDVIRVKLWINEKGRVTRVAILDSQLPPQDEDEVVQQIVAALFVPAYKDGQPVASILQGGLSPN